MRLTLIKVMICDDLAEITDYYASIINAQEDMQVVCTVHSGKAAVEAIDTVHPDVILMDVQMENCRDGIEAAEIICEAHEDIKVIILTIHDSDDSIVEAYMAGACDYLLKDASEEKILNTIRLAYQNDNYMGQLLLHTLKKNVTKWKSKEVSLLYIVEHLTKLTSTELLILKGLLEKKKRSQLSEENCMSEHTVKVHIHHILSKLEFQSCRQMITELEKLNIKSWLENINK